ncbi:MAG: hypothetical protein IKM46_07095 [Clostridia bacterium]|nr:hypothetical protein [Clostridia bacterium]
MKMDKLQKAIENLDDDLLTETAKVRTGEKSINKLSVFTKYASAAACFCILIIGSLIVFAIMNDSKTAPKIEDIPEVNTLYKTESDPNEDEILSEADEEQTPEQTNTSSELYAGTPDSNGNTVDSKTDEESGTIPNTDVTTETDKDPITDHPAKTEVTTGTDADPITDPPEKTEVTTEKDTTHEPDDKTPDSSALPNNTNNKTENLSIAFKPLKVSLRDVNTNDKSNYYSFTTELFSKSHKNGENTLISPLSVYLALSMLTNGAEENTLAQLEEILGMSSDELNLFVKSYMSSLPNTTYSKMKIANSVWFRDAESFKVNDSFLQTNANYFSADIYKAPFNQSTVNDINSWVKEKTDGMIDKIVNEISETTVMYLINALSFEAEWENQYLEYDVGEGEFKTANGDVQTVEFMYGSEYSYLQDSNSKGFIKYYKGRDYAFVALLPAENVSIDDYVRELDSDKINGLLNSKKNDKTYTCIPKFKVEFDAELKDILSDMGISDVFSSNEANLSALGESSLGNLFVSSVLHKTVIEVNEVGTKAGAVTSVQIEAECAPSSSVILDRPFVYMIIDCENNLPLFIGTLNDPVQ